MSATGNDPVSAVLNQVPTLENYDLFATDRALRDAVRCFGNRVPEAPLRAAGRDLGSAATLALAARANANPPELRTHDRLGHRVDAVVFDEAWHELLGKAIGYGLVSLPWQDGGSQLQRAALFYLYAQAEAGTQCPVAMSFGAVPVLQKVADQHPSIAGTWLPGLLSGQYDRRFIPAGEKRGLLLGMGMTERQGGSDVRRTLSVARAVTSPGPGRLYRLRGHKWFFSAPMCDAFLVLAQAAQGISCFLLPRFREDGSLNALRLQRLKDKLGNRSNASSEVEFHDADAVLLGEEGRGVATIIEMATYTRVDCVLAAAGMQRRALAVAMHHAAHRETFGATLIRQPLMRAVLADMALEAEAATWLALYLASCYERDASDEDRRIGRLLTPAAKFHLGKRGPPFAAEAMEVLGGNGYVEEQDLPRIYRELPLLSIWEGSGNVMCLDVLRTLGREPECGTVLLDRLAQLRGANDALDRHAVRLEKRLQRPTEHDARQIAHAIALAVEASLLLEHAPSELASAFCNTRLDPQFTAGSFGAVAPAGSTLDLVLQRASPAAE